MSDDLEARLTFVREYGQTSPYYKTLGMSMEAVEDGRVVLRVEIHDQHLNADGIVHGGVLPAIADGAMGNALRTIKGEHGQVFTAEINLQFLRPVTGGVLLAEGKVVQSGRRVSFAEVEIRDATSGKTHARGTGVFVIQEREPPG